MSQNVERAAAMKKMRQFAVQTMERGRTEGEMNMAMRQLQKLSTAFNISLDELNLKDEPCIELRIDTGSVIDTYMDRVLTSISNFTGCVVYRSPGEKTAARDAEGNLIYKTFRRRNRKTGKTTSGIRYKMVRGNIDIVFFGLESDVEMAGFLYNMIQASVELEKARFKKSAEYRAYLGPKKSASHSFVMGMTGRISSRLQEMADEMSQEVFDAQAGERDIMVVKSDYVDKELKATGVTLKNRKKPAPRVRSHSGFNAGRNAGDKLNLSRPVESDRNETLLLS